MQIDARALHLPEGTTQRVYVDIRGQELPVPERQALAQRIADRSAGAVRPGDIMFIEED